MHEDTVSFKTALTVATAIMACVLYELNDENLILTSNASS